MPALHKGFGPITLAYGCLGFYIPRQIQPCEDLSWCFRLTPVGCLYGLSSKLLKGGVYRGINRGVS